jgi:hypothetical protein
MLLASIQRRKMAGTAKKKKKFNAYLGLWLVTKDMSVFGCSNFEHDAFLTIWCFLNVTSDEDLLKLQVAGDG